MPRRPHRPNLVAMVVVLAGLVGACDGGGRGSLNSPHPTVTVLPSADRIRLGQTRLGGPASCVDDEYCAAGLGRVYGIDLGNRVVSLSSPVATIGALVGGAVDIGVMRSSAVELSDSRVTTLIDDRSLTPADNIVPIVTNPLIQATGPALGTTLDAVSAELDQAGLDAVEQALAGGTAPQDAAQHWLDTHATKGTAPAASSTPILIGARSDPESTALAELYGGALQRAGWTTSVVHLDGDRTDELDGLSGGRINLAIENLSAMLEHLNGFIGTASADEARTLALLQTRLADRGLSTMEPARSTPGFSFVVSRPVDAALGVSSLSDLAHASGAHAPATIAPVPVPAAPTTSPPGDLGIGSKGPDVTAIQARLTELGYARQTATGVFDEATRLAVVGFQIDHALISDGAVDAATRRAMAAAVPGSRPSVAPVPGDPDSLRPPPTLPGAGRTGTVYLAFAGGPSPVTPQILGLLRTRSATATFFADDGAATRHADLLRAVRDAGDGIGIWMGAHNSEFPVAADVMLRTAGRTQDDVASIIGRTPSCVLGPYGATDPDTRARASGRGWKMALADIDPQDWRRPGADVITGDVFGNVHAGSVVMLHDGGGDRAQTVTALGAILDILSQRGYSLAAIPDCVPTGP